MLHLIGLAVGFTDAEQKALFVRSLTWNEQATVNGGIVQEWSVAVADLDVILRRLVRNLDHVLVELVTGLVVELDAVSDAPVLDGAVLF